MRNSSMVLALILSVLIVVPASANSVGSSTMEFEGTLTDNGDGTYTGVIPMIVDGAYDIYAEEGGTAWFGDDPGTGPVWTSQAIGADHDAWPTWNPDTPDWYQYSLELSVDGSITKWAVRNHPGADATNPWYDEVHWGAGGKPPAGVPMAGLMGYSYLYAVETEVGAYLSGTGTPEIPGGAAVQGGGPGAWDMDWSWGSEVVPLEYSGFDVDIQDLGSGKYHVTLTPAALTEVWVDDDFTAATPGWGVTHFASIQDGIDAVEGSTVNVADGTYTIATTLNVNKSVIIDGESEAGVILDASGCAGYGMLVTAGGVVLRDMTMLPPAVNYPIHASGTGNPPDGYDGLTIEHMTIEGVHQRTAFDIHGYSNVVLSYLTAGDATGGNGIQVTGCLGVDMDNIVTYDNAWGSIAIYVSKSTYLNRGSDDVEIDGDSCTLGEGNIYSQDEDGLTNTNVAVLGYEYLVKNDVAAPGYDLFQDTLTDAAAVAAAVGADSYIIEIATGDLVVLSGMSIQAAIDAADPGDTIDVAAGAYAEQLVIDKALSLIGAGETATFIQPGAYPVINVTANNVTIQDLAVTDPAELAEGIQVNSTANLTLTRVNFPNLGAGAGANAYGVDFKADFTGLTVTDCEFGASAVSYGVYTRSIGIFAPNDLTLGSFSVTDCTFDEIWTSIYLRSGIDGLDVTGCAFGWVDPADYAACVAGIYIGDGTDDNFDLRNISVTGNEFTDYGRGVYVWNYAANATVQNFVISDNTFTDTGWSAGIRFIFGLSGMENYSIDGLDINNNTFTQSADCGGYVGLIDLRTYDATLMTCDISVTDNELTFTGAPYTDAMYGIGFMVGGDGFYNTTVSGNVIDGGGTGGAGAMAAAGMKISHYADDYTWTHVLDLDIVNNAILGFDHGFSVYNSVAASYGGLPAGTDVAINGNSIVGDVLGIRNDDGIVVDASGNWWGTADPTAVAAEFMGPVDYTPWLGVDSDTSADPGYQPDYSVLGVDDDGPQTGTAGRINEALGMVSGSTINVAPGTYAESILFESGYAKDGVVIDGDDSSRPEIIGGIRFTQTADIDGVTFRDLVIKGMAAGGNAMIDFDNLGSVSDLTIDGCLLDGELISGQNGLTGNKLDGILTITDNEMKDVLGWALMDIDSSYAGPPYGGNELVFTEITFSGNHIHECNGTVSLRGNDVTPTANAYVFDNVVENLGGNGGEQGQLWAGVELNHCADADIYGNVVQNIAEGQWGEGQAFQLWDIGDIDFYGNQILSNYEGVFFYGGSAGGSYGGPYAVPTGSLHHNAFVGNTQYGVSVDPNCTGGPLNAEMNWWGDVSGPSTSKGTGDKALGDIDYDPWIGAAGGENIVCDPDPLDLNIATSSGSIDVNYLGGGGGMLFGYSVTVTWDPAIATLTGITEGSLLSDAGGTNFFYYGTGGTRTIDCTLTPPAVGVTGPGTLFTLDFDAAGSGVSTVDLTLVAFRDNANQPLSGFYENDGLINADISAPVFTDVGIENLTLAHTDAYAKNGDDLKLTATVSDDYLLEITGIEADLSVVLDGGGTAVNPDTYIGGDAVWLVPLEDVTLTSDGTKAIEVTLRDWAGNTAYSSLATVTLDNTPPTGVLVVDASPAHQEVDLTWGDATATDANYYGVMVRYNVWGDYPTYDLATPVYPATETDGTEALSGDYQFGAIHGIVPRDIHYYSVFAYDWALNYGPVTGDGQDRATNYWLGDVAAALGVWGENGLVNAADIDKLGYSYGVGAGAGTFDARCDVGPTDDASRVGIPEPDDFVSFEDLMIFAMNYGVVAPRVVPFLSEPGMGDLALALSEVGRSADVVTLALRLEGNLGEVKGLSTELEFEGLEFLSAGLSDEMSAPVADVFFWGGATALSTQVDLAVLGTDVTIGGSGDVATLTFRVLDDAYTIDFASAELRGAENDELTAELKGLTVDDIPASFRLVQNTPNPFNPVTTIGYHMLSESQVTIRVYDVTGRLVTTLVDRVMEPGRHSVAWNGTNDYGEPVGSGVYFCTMETPEYHGSHKMTLLK